MKETIKFYGSTFKRDVTIIGDVEKITWYQIFEKGQGTELEVYDSDLANDLEEAYETQITENIFRPHKAII